MGGVSAVIWSSLLVLLSQSHPCLFLGRRQNQCRSH
jgi:hypothetical protein